MFVIYLTVNAGIQSGQLGVKNIPVSVRLTGCTDATIGTDPTGRGKGGDPSRAVKPSPVNVEAEAEPNAP